MYFVGVHFIANVYHEAVQGKKRTKDFHWTSPNNTVIALRAVTLRLVDQGGDPPFRQDILHTWPCSPIFQPTLFVNVPQNIGESKVYRVIVFLRSVALHDGNDDFCITQKVAIWDTTA